MRRELWHGVVADIGTAEIEHLDISEALEPFSAKTGGKQAQCSEVRQRRQPNVCVCVDNQFAHRAIAILLVADRGEMHLQRIKLRQLAKRVDLPVRQTGEANMDELQIGQLREACESVSGDIDVDNAITTCKGPVTEPLPQPGRTAARPLDEFAGFLVDSQNPRGS